MHEGLVKACNDLGIDTETNLLTMEDISEEDTALLESTVGNRWMKEQTLSLDVPQVIPQSWQNFSRNIRM